MFVSKYQYYSTIITILMGISPIQHAGVFYNLTIFVQNKYEHVKKKNNNMSSKLAEDY